jgi:hypothetical protein
VAISKNQSQNLAQSKLTRFDFGLHLTAFPKIEISAATACDICIARSDSSRKLLVVENLLL